MRGIGREERQQPTAAEFFEKPIGIMDPHACGLIGRFGRCAAPRGGTIPALGRPCGGNDAQRYDFHRRRVLNEAAPRLARRDLDVVAIGPSDAVESGQIAVIGSRWMVRLVEGEEAPGCARARLERDGK